ncbi:MAG: hypothetical protein GY846_22680 [Deltaproteobacteria bacterium]|nr:hypothetical protein [Deltaproteobacteria bacterium]
MDYKLTKEQLKKKKEYDDFFREEMEHAPIVYQGASELEARFSSDEAWSFHRSMQKKLAARGWLTQAWPKEHGGRDASIIEQLIFREVHAYHHAPGIDGGINLFAPTLLMFGTEEQKAQLLPPISRGEVNYCQGWSEPNAGSDLAAVEMLAIREGDHFVINGQKIWTTGAHRADYIFILVRTDTTQTRSRGLSVFSVKMDTPGIEVRPIHYMDGKHLYNEVYFTDVKVHENCLIGVENEGWQSTRATMNFERSGVVFFVQARRRLRQLLKYVKNTRRGTKYLYENPLVRQKIARMYADTERGLSLAYRVAWNQEKGNILASAHEASESKVHGTELVQRMSDFATEIMGLYGQLGESKWAPLNGVMVDIYQWCLGGTISMGSNEIQRNIIAWIGLGLPRFK